jgi:hypothetical protein
MAREGSALECRMKEPLRSCCSAMFGKIGASLTGTQRRKAQRDPPEDPRGAGYAWPRLPRAPLSMSKTPDNPIEGAGRYSDRPPAPPGTSHFTSAQDALLLERVLTRDQQACDLFDRYGSTVVFLAPACWDTRQAEDTRRMSSSPGKNREFYPGPRLAGRMAPVVTRTAPSMLCGGEGCGSVDEVVRPQSQSAAMPAHHHDGGFASY